MLQRFILSVLIFVFVKRFTFVKQLRNMKLTQPQQKLKTSLESGRTFATFNAHYANAGEYRFVDNGELVSYKVFWNLQYALKENKFDFKAVHTGRYNHSYHNHHQ